MKQKPGLHSVYRGASVVYMLFLSLLLQRYFEEQFFFVTSRPVFQNRTANTWCCGKKFMDISATQFPVSLIKEEKLSLSTGMSRFF